MAPKANVFAGDFDAFRESIANLAHYQFIVEWRLKEANKSAERSLAAFK